MFSFVFIVVVVLASVQLYLNRSIQTFLIAQSAETLQRDMRLARILVSDGLRMPAVSYDQLADDLGQKMSLRVTLMNAQGIVLGDSVVPEPGLANLENHADRPEIQAALKTGEGMSVRFSETLQTEMLYVAATLPGPDSQGAIVRLAMPLRDVGLMKRPISRAIWISSAMGLALAVLLAYGSSVYVSRPLVEMTRVARNLASGIPAQRYPAGAISRELKELALALNEMRQQIESRIELVTLEKSRLEAVLSSITEGILVTEQSGRVSMANREFEKLFGVTQDPVGRMPIELVRHREVQNAIEETLKTGQVVFLDLTLSGGLERHLDVHVAPIKQGDRSVGSVTVFYDITELRRLERIRKDFVANVSHELRTPLTAIKGCAATLADGALADREAAKRFVDMINTHADRLHSLVEDVLDLSRMESGTVQVEREKCAVDELVSGAIEQVRSQSVTRKINLIVSLGEPVFVVCDYKLIERALVNLLDNAIKYTQEGGTVRVVLNRFTKEPDGRSEMESALGQTPAGHPKVPGKRVGLEIQDTGIGIPLSAISRIFERFYRVDLGRSRALGGTGLGLSIVKHIMEAHGERVYVESQQGRGSTFGLTLPLS
jgi:two-component system, OmpR family, phosphate regulon sensor histidine kinase PhoR